LSNSTWQLLLCTGEIPTKRISHSSVIYSDYMVVFGGFFKNFNVMGQVIMNLKCVTAVAIL
jgi:hypothetical protein